MSYIKYRYLLVAILIFLPLSAYAYLGQYGDPVYVEIKTDPMEQLKYETQQSLLRSQQRLDQTIQNGQEQSRQILEDIRNGQQKIRAIEESARQQQLKNEEWLQQRQMTSCPVGKIFFKALGLCICDVVNGYASNGNKECVKINLKCPVNSSYINGSCKCDKGYTVKGSKCIVESLDDLCHNDFGLHSYSTGRDEEGRNRCKCAEGYKFVTGIKPCVQDTTNGENIGTSVAPKPSINEPVDAEQAPTTTDITPKIIPVTNKGSIIKDFVSGIGSFFKSIFR